MTIQNIAYEYILIGSIPDQIYLWMRLSRHGCLSSKIHIR